MGKGRTMMDFDERLDALSGRRRSGVINAIGRLVGIALVGLLLVLTIAILL